MNLGRSGLRVSRLALGTMNFGMTTDESVSHHILHDALECGINLVDTADVYGGPQAADMAQGYGISDEFIGRWLVKSSRRDGIVLATKVYQPMGLGPNDRRLSAYHLRRACEASLRRLGTDHIDLYQMHHVARTTPWEEIWQAMDQLVREGKITYVGSSNFAGWDIAVAQAVADRRELFGLVSEQSLYNLTTRAIELEVIPALGYHGIGLIPWSPLAGGVLAGVLEGRSGERRDHDQIQDRAAALQPQVAAYETLCKELGEEPANVALAWLLHQPAVTSAIIGPRTVEQLGAAKRAVDITLDDATLQRLDEIWPGPGVAPQSYAW
jgi:aryl-alcohol dehydrogenase-like predicted oxidoreductase